MFELVFDFGEIYRFDVTVQGINTDTRKKRYRKMVN
jgi:hypothetical protein